MGDGSTLVNLRDTTNKLIFRVLREGDGTDYGDWRLSGFNFLLRISWNPRDTRALKPGSITVIHDATLAPHKKVHTRDRVYCLNPEIIMFGPHNDAKSRSFLFFTILFRAFVYIGVYGANTPWSSTHVWDIYLSFLHGWWAAGGIKDDSSLVEGTTNPWLVSYATCLSND